VKLVVVLLEVMPLLLRIHLLHFLAQRYILAPQDLKPLIEPLESLKHGHASLFPKHRSNLRFIGPHRVFLLVVHVIEFTMLVVAHGHGLAGREKLRIRVDIFLDI
jgi:hypothetical protein